MTALLEDVAQQVRLLSQGGNSGAGALLARNNLSDLADLVLSRANLGLGNSATQDVGMTAGTVAAGDDPRFGTGASGFSGAPYPTLTESLAGVHIPAGSLDRLRTNPKPGQWIVSVALTASPSDNQVWIPGSEEPYPTPPAEEVPGEVVGVAFNFPQTSTFPIQIGNETLLVRGGNGTYFSQVPNATFYDALPSSHFPITITPGHMHPHIGSGGGSFHTPEGYLIGYTAYTPTSATTGYFTVNTAPHIASIPPGYWCKVPWHVARAQNGTTLAAHGIGSVIQTTATRTIVAVGDSITFGTDTPESFVDFMRRALSIPNLGMGYRGVWALEWEFTAHADTAVYDSSHYNDGSVYGPGTGSGWSAIASGSTYDYFPWNDATLTTTHGIYGQVSTSGGHAGDHATYTPRPDQGTIETLEFVWLETATSGNMSYQWNGAGAWTTIASSSSAVTVPTLRRTEVVIPATFNSVTVRAAPANGTPNGTCYFGGCVNHAIATYTNVGQIPGNGLNAFAATGTLVHNIAAGGNELGVLVRSGSGDSLRFLDGDAASLYPDLIVVGTFTNDYPLSTDPATYFIPALQALRDRSAGYADMLIVLCYENNRLAAGPTHATYQTQMDYRNAVKAWAVTNNVAVVDLFEAWAAWLGYDPTDATGVGWAAAASAGLLFDGLIHANQAAQLDMGNRLNRALNANGPLVSPQPPPLNFDTANNFLVNQIPNLIQTNYPNYIDSTNSFSNTINLTGIGSAGAQLDFVHWAGTHAAPTLTPAGAVMSYLGTFGYTGSNNNYGAALQVVAEEDYGSSNAGATRMDFYTKKSATSGLQYGMALDNAGHLYGAPTLTSNHVSGYAWKLGYTGDVAAVSYFAAGKTGATQDTTWIGGTPSGAPTISSPTAGMFAIGLDATLWVYDGSTWNSNNVGGSGSGTFPKVIINGTISSGSTFKSLTETKTVGPTTALSQFTHIELNDPTLATTTGAPYTRALAGVNWTSGLSNIFSTANSFTTADVGSSITLGAVTTTITSFTNAGVVGIDPAHLPATTQGTDVPKTVTRGTTATGYTGTSSTGSAVAQTGLWIHALSAASGTNLGIQNDADSLLGGTTTLNNVVINGTYSGPSGTLIAPFPTLGQQYAGIHIPPGGLDRYGQRSRPASTWLWNSINNSTDTLVRPYNFALFPTVDWTRFRKPLDWVASTIYLFNDRVNVSGAWWRCTTANSDATFTSGNWLRIGPAWISGTAYKVNDIAWVSGVYYRCVANVPSPYTTTPASDIYASATLTGHWQIDRNPAAHTIIIDSEQMVVQHGNGFVSVAAGSVGVNPSTDTNFAGGTGVIHVNGLGDIDPAPVGGTGSLNLSANTYLGSGPLVITYTGVALSGTDWTITGCTYVSGTGGTFTLGDEVRQGDANGIIWTVPIASRAANGTTIAAHTGYASSTANASVITTTSTDHVMCVTDSIGYGVSSPNPTGTYKSAESEGWVDRLRQLIAQPSLGAGYRGLFRADEWTDTLGTWQVIDPNTAATAVFPFGDQTFFWSGKQGTASNFATGCTVTNGSSSIAKTAHAFSNGDLVTVLSSANFPSTSATAFYIVTRIDADHFSLKLLGGSAIVATSSESITVQTLDTYEWVAPADQPCAGRLGFVWCDNSDADTWHYRINGGAWIAQTVNGSVGVARYTEISYPGQINTVDVLPPAVALTSVYLGGIVSFNSGPGVTGTLFSQLGFVGQSLGQYQGNDEGLFRLTAGDCFAYFNSRGGSFEPSLVILEVTNDLNNIGWSHSATGSISGTTLTTTGLNSGDVGKEVTGTGVTAGTIITAFSSSTSATVSPSQTVSSTSITVTLPTTSTSYASVVSRYCRALDAIRERVGAHADLVLVLSYYQSRSGVSEANQLAFWQAVQAHALRIGIVCVNIQEAWAALGINSWADSAAYGFMPNPANIGGPHPTQLGHQSIASIVARALELGSPVQTRQSPPILDRSGNAQILGSLTTLGAASVNSNLLVGGYQVVAGSQNVLGVITPTGGFAPPSGSTASSIPLRGSGTWFAADYGILVDGSDQGAAINTLLVAAAAAGISRVILPPGVVVSGRTIFGRSGVILVGSGMLASRLKLANGSNCVLYRPALDSYYGGIENVLLDGNVANQAADDWHPTLFTGTTPTWTSGTPYTVGQDVVASSVYYRCILDIPNPYTTAVTNTTYWVVITPATDPAFKFRDIQIKNASGRGYDGESSSSSHQLINVTSRNCRGEGIVAGYDTQINNCMVAYNGLSGIVLAHASAQVTGKSFNNGLAPWWNGTAATYANSTHYAIGDGVLIGGTGVVYVATDDIPSSNTVAPNAGTTAQKARWFALTQGQGFVYSSSTSTVALCVSSAGFYLVKNASGITDTFASSSGSTDYTAISAVTNLVPQGAGVLVIGAAADEITACAIDSQQNSGSSYYFLGGFGNVLVGTAQQPNCNQVSGLNRLKNPLRNAAVTLDSSSCIGNTITVSASRLAAGSDRNGSGGSGTHIAATDVDVLYIAGAATTNNVTLSGDGTGVVPASTTIGTGNLVVWNGTFPGDVTFTTTASFGTSLTTPLILDAAGNSAIQITDTAGTTFHDRMLFFDATGAKLLDLVEQGTPAVNYFQIGNAVAGSPVPIAVAGTDTDISITAIPKGVGVFNSQTGFRPLGGITGTTSGSRYIGATASGAPASGAHTLGDFVIAQDGHIWICTTSGTPGTWTDAGAAGGTTYSAGSGLTLTSTTFSIGAGQVTNAMLAGSITAANLVKTDITTLSALVSVGTVTTGVWNATAVGVAYGGTGLASYAVGDLLYASGATTLSKLADVATGSILVSGGVTTAPAWSSAPTIGGALTVTGAVTANAAGTSLTTNQDIVGGRDISAGRDISITRNLAVTGTSGFSDLATFSRSGTGLTVTNGATVGTLTLTNALTAPYGGTGLSSFTTGDILYASASNTLSALAKGTSGQFLKQGASVQSWATIAESDVTSLVADLALKAPLASPTFTGTVTIPVGLNSTDALQVQQHNNLKPTGALFESVSRTQFISSSQTTLTSGNEILQGIWLPAGLVIGHIAYHSAGTTTAGSSTHGYFALYDNTGLQLAVTADQTSVTWAQFNLKSLAIANTGAGAGSTFTTTYSGWHYIGVNWVSSPMPTLYSFAMATGLVGLSPLLATATSINTGLGAPSTAVSGGAFTRSATITTAGGNLFYGYVAT